MITYILSNGMLAAGTINEKAFYNGQWFDLVEDVMDGRLFFEDANCEVMMVVGMMEEIDFKDYAIYALNESEYDLVREHISLNADDNYQTYHVFNDVVFFGFEKIKGAGFNHYGTYDAEGNLLEFSDIESAEKWANTI